MNGSNINTSGLGVLLNSSAGAGSNQIQISTITTTHAVRTVAVAPASGFTSVKNFSDIPLANPAGSGVNFPLPKDTFVHVISGTKLTYRARQTDGSPLPDWVSINASTGEITISKSIDASQENLLITVTAVDPSGNTADSLLVFNFK